MKKSFPQQRFDCVLTCIGLYIQQQSPLDWDHYRNSDLAASDRLSPTMRGFINYAPINLLAQSVEQAVALFGEARVIHELSVALCL